jgi:hypothetical protein
VNYIANPLFADGTVTGWATYADAAATTPVDGTGGSPNVTFTAQSGSLVRGTFSGRLTKDAANRQGQGASYDFTIDAADTGRPVSIALDFLASAAYVANDVGVYIYDVTNATLISPAAINVAAGKGTFKAFFVATTSTSYRLILHVASTNASAWTLDTDNFQVGPQVQLSGAPVTDWQSFTPTGTWVSNTTYAGRYRRVGDSVQVEYEIVTSGAPTATQLLVNLPSGLTPDSTKITNPGQSVGTARIRDGGVQTYAGVSYINSSTSGTSTLGIISDDAGEVTQTVPFTWGSGDSLFLDAVVQISNWSSNVTMADRAVEEYVSHDGSIIITGINGALIPTTTPAGAGDTYIITGGFSGAIQATDSFNLEVLIGGTGRWIPTPSLDIEGLRFDGTNLFGATVDATSGAVVQIVRGKYRRGATDTWASLSANSRWRVRRKVSGGAAAGPVGARNVVGDTTGTAVPAGYIGETLTFTARTTTGSYGSVVTNATPLVTLTAGVWIVYAYANYNANTSASFLGFYVATNSVADFTGVIAECAIAYNIVTTAANTAVQPIIPRQTVIAGSSGQALYAKSFSEDAAVNVTVGGFATRIA